jgi:ADP-ribose pyrophosphatase YjhB (NUDIX family)
MIVRDGRRFACIPAAVLAFIVNADERVFMLAHPNSGWRWEIINGALEHGETLLEGCLREICEEAGNQLQVRPLSLLHAYSFPYAENVPHMLSLCYLFAYEGGEVIPGDDMVSSQVRWVSPDEIARGEVEVIVPRDMPWLFERAVELYRLLKDRPPVLHQPQYDSIPPRKYPK